MAGITVEVFDSRLKAILTAIPGDDPGGTDVRDEDISDDIDDACKELSRPGAEIGDDTDFSWVDSAEKLLVEKSKDIKVLTQWMYGLVLRDKAAGLALGVSALRGVLQEHWEGLWPRKLQSRYAAVQYLKNERFLLRVRGLKPKKADRRWVKAAVDELEAIKPLLISYFGKSDKPIALTELEAIAGQLVKDLGPEEKAADENPDADSGAAEPSPEAEPGADPEPVAEPTAGEAGDAQDGAEEAPAPKPPEVPKDIQAFRTRLEKIVTAIPGDDPGGADIRDDDVYYDIDEACKDLARPGATIDQDTDFSWVAAAEKLIVSKSKDVKVLTQWLFGLVLTERTAGWALGISALRRLMDECWDGLWPRKLNSRYVALQYLKNERFLVRIKGLKPDNKDRKWIKILLEELDAFKPILVSQFGKAGKPISLTELSEIAEAFLEKLGPEEEAPEEVAETAPATPSEAPVVEGEAVEEEAEEAEDDPWVLELLEPIPGDDPTGEDPRDSDEPSHPFEAANDIYNTLAAGRGDPREDWPALAEACELTLRKWAKDLFVVSWLTMALHRTSGFHGLLRGLQVLQGILANMGEACHPRRQKARASAIRLLNERLPAPIKALHAADADDAKLVILLARISITLKEAAASARAILGPISLGQVTEAIDDLLRAARAKEKEKAEAERPPESAKPAEEPAAAAGGAEPSGTPATGATAAPPAIEGEITAAAVSAALVRYARDLRAAQPQSALSYRLLRVGLWSEIQDLPAAKGGVTALGIDQRQVQRVTGLATAMEVENPEWAAISNHAENLLSEGPAARFWLDLNRISHEALSKLGEEYESAAQAVAFETGMLLKKCPGMEQLSFAGGQVPFADGATQAWLSNEVKPLLGGGGGGGGTVPAEALQPVEDAFSDDDLKKALPAFYAWFRPLGPGPLKVHGVLSAVRHLLSKKNPRLAHALLSELDSELQRTQAHLWLPDLCVQVLAQLHMCNQTLQVAAREQRKETEAQAIEQLDRELVARIASLDWSQAGMV